MALLLLTAAAVRADDPAQAAPNPQADPADFRRDIAPLLQRHCFACHGPKTAKGGLTLHQFADEQAVLKSRDRWESVLEMLESEVMPPKNGRPLPPADRRKLVGWIESTLFHLDCQISRDPGRVTIRRLNRAEYNNTVRDLLGVNLRPADQFPSDDVGNGFDNMGDVLSLPPLLLEKYLQAAEELAAAAIVAPEDLVRTPRTKSGRELSTDIGQLVQDAYIVVSVGEVFAKFAIAEGGEHVLAVRAAGDQAGPDPVRAEVRVDGKAVKTLDIAARRGAPQEYEVQLPLAKGLRRLSVRFVNDYYQPRNRDPKLRGDRNLWVHQLSLRGPLKGPGATQTAFQKTALVARPSDERTAAQAAQQCLLPLVRRAFRRKVDLDDVTPYVRLVELAMERGESFERGMQVALTAVLVSPHFLFRVETDPNPHDVTNVHPVTQDELACRLSYFLWSSMPDQELFEAAREGRLSDIAVLKQQTLRMLRDPKANALASNFAAQWLNLRNLDELTPDPIRFPEFDEQLRDDMKRETLALFQTLLRENRSVVEFLTADFSFVNERLARHYGLAGVAGAELQRVRLEPRRSAGVLTHGSILTLTSNPDRTSPVKRGKWIMENLLGTPPPDPPDGVPELAATQKASPQATLREQLELHRKDPNCAVCHVQMDAIGFGLENFDAVGRWRDSDGGQPIDSAGTLPDDAADAAPGASRSFSGAAQLAKILARDPQKISRTLARKLLSYSLGRGLQYYDQCAIDTIIEKIGPGGHRFQDLVLAVVTSEPFLYRRGESKAP